MSVTDVGVKGPALSEKRDRTVSNDSSLIINSGRVALTSQNLLHLL